MSISWSLRGLGTLCKFSPHWSSVQLQTGMGWWEFSPRNHCNSRNGDHSRNLLEGVSSRCSSSRTLKIAAVWFKMRGVVNGGWEKGGIWSIRSFLNGLNRRKNMAAVELEWTPLFYTYAVCMFSGSPAFHTRHYTNMARRPLFSVKQALHEMVF